MILDLVTDFLLVLCAILCVWALKRERSERTSSRPHAPPSFQDLGELSPAEYEDVHVNPWSWTAMRVGGGGVFTTPDLPRADAIDYVTRCGSHQLCAVDDVHKIIFYRSL